MLVWRIEVYRYHGHVKFVSLSYRKSRQLTIPCSLSSLWFLVKLFSISTVRHYNFTTLNSGIVYAFRLNLQKIVNEQHEDLQQKRDNLLTPSRVKLTMSITPPVGCVSNPRRPFPIPLKNPSTPSERAPKQNKFIKRKNSSIFLSEGKVCASWAFE